MRTGALSTIGRWPNLRNIMATYLRPAARISLRPRARLSVRVAVVAADLEAVGAPAGVAGINRDAPVVTTIICLAAMALEQQAMHLHHPVDPLGIGRRRSAIVCLPPQERMDPAVAIGRQFGDQSLDMRDEIFLGQRRSAAAACSGLASG